LNNAAVNICPGETFTIPLNISNTTNMGQSGNSLVVNSDGCYEVEFDAIVGAHADLTNIFIYVWDESGRRGFTQLDNGLKVGQKFNLPFTKGTKLSLMLQNDRPTGGACTNATLSIAAHLSVKRVKDSECA